MTVLIAFGAVVVAVFTLALARGASAMSHVDEDFNVSNCSSGVSRSTRPQCS